MATKKEKPSGQKPRRRRVHSNDADWSAIDDGTIARVVAAVTLSGGAVRFGCSRDGGAFSIGVYGDGKPYTEFCPGNGDVEGWLEGFILDYE